MIGSGDSSCYNSGFNDGQMAHLVNQHGICGDEEGGDDAYYAGFIDGCISVEGNTRDVCESATDAGRKKRTGSKLKGISQASRN